MSHPADTPNKIRLLHVDDEEFQLEAVKGFLNLLDPYIEVISVSSPIEALSIIRQEYFDCIVTDYKMPEINGIDLSKKIRAEKNLPIILYTGQGSEEVAEAAFIAGINDYIRKEINTNHYHILVRKIRDAVEKYKIEELYTRVVEDAREAIAIIFSGKIVYSNRALSNLLGEKKPQDVVGKKFIDFLLPNDREDVEKILSQPIHENESRYHQIVLRQRSGKKFVAELSISLIKYGGTQAVLYFVRDISARLQLEEDIQSKEGRFRVLVNMNPDGIALLNMKGEITWLNPMFVKILGYSETELLGKSFFSFGVNPTLQYIKNIELFRTLLKGTTIPPFELQWLTKDKSRVWGEAHFSLVDVGIESQEVMVITRDITSQKKIKEELEEYSKKLEKLVHEKTIKLMDSEKMITAGKLTTLLGNDIREPLLTIKNAVNYIRLHPQDKKIGLENINKALILSITMLDDLRTKTRDNPLKLKELYVSELINEAINDVPISPSIKVKLDISHIKIVVDEKQVKRVLINLIQNAIDAMKEYGELNIIAKPMGENIVIEIKDNGCGITQENMKNIFKPFFTTKNDGIGLGLNYSKKVIESHKGMITVNSNHGNGTQIHIQLPLNGPLEKNASIVQIPK